MATAEEINAFRAQENLEGIVIPEWMRPQQRVPDWLLEKMFLMDNEALNTRFKTDHAGLGDLEWIAEFQDDTGPNILVEDQETFTDPELFAEVFGANKRASVEDKVALYLETKKPQGAFTRGFRYRDGGEGFRWQAPYEDFPPSMHDSIFGTESGVVDYDDDRTDDAFRPETWDMAERALKGKMIRSGVSYLHPANLHADIEDQQTIWQHEALHGVFDEIMNNADIDPWFKKLMGKKKIKSESGRDFGFEEMVTRIIDAKVNGDIDGLYSIIDIPAGALRAYRDYSASIGSPFSETDNGEKSIDADKYRDILKTTISYFAMADILEKASRNNEYMSEDYLKTVELLTGVYAKLMDDAPLDELLNTTLNILDSQDTRSWTYRGNEKYKESWDMVEREWRKTVQNLAWHVQGGKPARPIEDRPSFQRNKQKKIAELFEDPTGEIGNEFYRPRGLEPIVIGRPEHWDRPRFP